LWLIEAQRHIGVKEIKGAKHNSFILFGLNHLKRGGKVMKFLGAVFLSRIASKKQSVSYRSIG